MSQSLISKAVVKAYEELNISLSDLASEYGLSVTEIKVCLLQHSSKYRSEQKSLEVPSSNSKQLSLNSGPALEPDDFSNEDEEFARKVIAKTMDAEDPYLAFKAATYIRDDKKGRKDAIKAIAKIGMDVAEFNLHMRRAFEHHSASKISETSNDKKSVIEV